jgi:regulator of protease activity HflC (stomatin/prohibitin superfamily)
MVAALNRADTMNRAMGYEGLSFYFVLIVFAVAFLAASIKICRDHERLAVFTLGRYSDMKGPGLVFVIAVIQTAVRVDLNDLDPHWRHASETVLNQKVKEFVLK